MHLPPVIHPKFVFDLLPHKNIFRYRQIRERGYMLIDRSNSHLCRINRTLGGNPLSL